jgi:predicted nucleic acid-binding protein
MTVIDTSAVIDFLLADGVAEDVEALFTREGELAAPDLLVFEVLAVLHRDVLRGAMARDRAQGALADLGDLTVDLFPSMSLRGRAWELRDNFTAADALFVALAELLDEPLATKDRSLLKATQQHTQIETLELA